MRCLHNRARAKVGRSALRTRSMLLNSSNAKSAEMLLCDEFSHTACGRSTPRVALGLWREHCSGTGRHGTARSIMSAWLHSEGHRTNILRSLPRRRDQPPGKATSSRRNASVWTAHFGYRSGY